MAEGRVEIVRTVQALRGRLAGWRAAGQTVGLVPTMGALHDGHLSLLVRARETTDRSCVTLFVNPKQFGEGEDYGVYPRDEAADAGALSARGADLLFIPEVAEMYPQGFTTRVSLPGIGDVLEGECRPGFFTGVATVVTKLLCQALPDAAFFGEKDYQQLCIVRCLARDLDLPVEIVGCPIIREPDGLALSSRNAYLSPQERAVAPQLQATLQAVRDAIVGGEDSADAITRGEAGLIQAGFAGVDYIALRAAETLAPVETPAGPARLLSAAWLGKTRLIDNIAVG